LSGSAASIIRGRRTVHDFRPGEAPPEATVLDAVEHATWAPNHYLSQPWRFRLLGPETREGICVLNAELARAKGGDKAADHKLRRWREIPGWLLLSCVRSEDPVREREDFAACCCAAQNLMLVLWEKGIGVKWTTGEVTRHARFFEIVGIDPTRETPVGLFWYGYAASVPETARRPVAEILTRLP
jgi:nitroreductase